MSALDRRNFLSVGAAAGLAVVTHRRTAGSPPTRTTGASTDRRDVTPPGTIVTINARPAPIRIDTARTAIIVCDMQNDFGAEGGMFQRAGIDISMIRGAVGPTATVLSSARSAGVPVIYLKMGFQPDLADAGAADSPNRLKHMGLGGIGTPVPIPGGGEGRILIRETWNTDIIPELAPQPGDVTLYKHRFSGFYETQLDTVLRQHGIKYLIVTGCTTSVCVESTIRDAMFRDYSCILLADCTGEPIGHDLPRSNHEASLLLIETLLGWVSESASFVGAMSIRN